MANGTHYVKENFVSHVIQALWQQPKEGEWSLIWEADSHSAGY